MTIRLALGLILCAAVVAGAETTPPRGLAAACVACSRSCPGKCVPRGADCVCSTNLLYDCVTACEAKTGADAAALEKCRADCRAKLPNGR